MNKTVETLLTVAIGAISSGVAFVSAGDIVIGSILLVSGIAIIAIRGFVKNGDMK